MDVFVARQPADDESAAAPFREFVVKVHGGCQLACDYCFMYQSVDAWSARSRPMPMPVLKQTARRIAEHAHRHAVTRPRVVFHGGEPLLFGPARLAGAAELIRRELGPGMDPEFTVQSNGLALDDRALTHLAGAGIRVGVSLDGSAEQNDRHRRFRSGRGSHDLVARGLALLREKPEMYAGLLAVVDLANDPVETYESLIAFAPPHLDLLLPHGNWAAPPPGRPNDDSTPYADWLIAVFERWYSAPRAETTIRLFQEIILGLFGRDSRSESIGLSPVGVIVVDVSGAIEQVDALRTTYAGAVDTALNVFDNSFDDALRHAEVRARQGGLKNLSATCRKCPLVAVCGAGYYPHRYTGRDFDAPSVYCRDLFKLIAHIRARVSADVARIVKTRTGRPSPGGPFH
ncbi:FxsB family cyclophane-forming radical SAM/SPASM peptide maturase [Actinoplanes regularis]|uniref:FxsB family cyclophane-forming radical SAM/SPASM peptide maturase n=1 Tax=Actinoplanes regularis TaxID=52697 RepID=UPI0024A012C3|nr:FxsB family cyclophane-forming radical SAM/SPASM peptide maturase [Actinoplanes regularis]GLW33853.1 hypothetical protein Areg01_67910 [Actinoplanes regularis]